MTSTSGDDVLPVSNRRETILGVTITFQVVAMLAVVLRLYARFKVVHSAGWDDVFVVLALMSVTTGTVFVCLAAYDGMGLHFATLSNLQLARYLFHFYVANATYCISTALIKISLLFQYLRILPTGNTRRLCLALLFLIPVWGAVYAFMAWVPCFPVDAYWDWRIPDPKCYAFGARTKAPFVAVYESHTALTMIFDLVVFIIPMTMYFRPSLSRREYVGIAGLSAMGAIVILLSLWRLVTIVHHEAGFAPTLDWTWWGPISIILACLEVDMAVLAASIPIFWPVIEAHLGKIFVTQVVEVTAAQRADDHDLEMDASSVRSGGSETRLHRSGSQAAYMHYKDAFVVEQVDPLKGSHRTTVRATN